MSEVTTKPVEKVVSLLKVIKYCCQYERLEKSVPQQIIDEAWAQLDVDIQENIIQMIEKNIQPTPKAIAEEMLACQSKEELTLLKAEFGAELSKEAWMLLSNDQKVQIQQMCATTPLPPEPELKPQASPPEPSNVPTERQISIELELPTTPMIQSELTKSKSLIELSEEEEELQEIISSVLEDTEGRIPPSLQEAFDELLSRQVENEQQLKFKLDNYCAVMKHMYDWAEVRTKEAERLKQLAEKDLGVAKVLEARLKNYLEISGKMKIKTKRFNPRICKNGGKTPIKLNVAVEDLPPKYQVKKELVNANFETLREVLETGEQLPFATLAERGTHLRYT